MGVTIVSTVFSFFDYENSEGIMSKRPRLSHIDWYGNAASVADSVIGIFEPAAIGVKMDMNGNDMDGMVEVLILKSPCAMPYSFWAKQGKGMQDVDRGDFDINIG